MQIRTLVFSLFFILICTTSALAKDVIGSVKTTKGIVTIIRVDTKHLAKIGFKIQHNDIIKTGADGAVGIIFIDDTILALGPDTEFVVDEYVFEPQKKKMSLLMRIIKGTASYLSGIIGKQSPDTVKLKTPEATIGMRGTRFLVKVD